MNYHGIPRVLCRKGLRSGAISARLARAFGKVLGWWSALPDKQLTRRGLMELPGDELSELGLVRERDQRRLQRLQLFRHRRV